MPALIGALVAALATRTVPTADLVVGDVVLFCDDRVENRVYVPHRVFDADPIVRVDDLGAHFMGGTYLMPGGLALVLEVA